MRETQRETETDRGIWRISFIFLQFNIFLFLYWRKCRAKVCRLSWMSYIVALCSSCTFFSFLGFIIRVHCVGLLWGQDVYVAGAAITIRLKPCPAIRVLSAMETQAVTELGYTTPSQLGWGVLGLKRTHQWKTVRDSEREKNRWRETELKIHKDSDRERETERETNKDWDRKRDK